MAATLHQTIHPQVRTIDGLSIRFAESEPRKNDALLLCPWPESLYAYEAGWHRFADHAHLVAIDLPGFGHSERRESLMAPRAMGQFIVRVADAFGLEQPHVVGPDVGTAASLFAAADFPDRFRSLTVGTGGAAVPMDLGSPLKEWVEAPDVEPWRRLDGREVVTVALGTLEHYQPTDTAREDYLSAYAGDRFADSLTYVRAYPRELPVLRDLLPGIQTPTLIITAARDLVVPPSNAEFLRQRLPHSRLEAIDGGHFIWEDSAAHYAALVTEWWDGAYKVPLQR